MHTKLIHSSLKITDTSYILDLPEFEYLRKRIEEIGFGNAKFMLDYNEFHEWADGVIREYHQGQALLKEFNDFADKLSRDHKRMMGENNG